LELPRLSVGRSAVTETGHWWEQASRKAQKILLEDLLRTPRRHSRFQKASPVGKSFRKFRCAGIELPSHTQRGPAFRRTWRSNYRRCCFDHSLPDDAEGAKKRSLEIRRFRSRILPTSATNEEIGSSRLHRRASVAWGLFRCRDRTAAPTMDSPGIESLMISRTALRLRILDPIGADSTHCLDTKRLRSRRPEHSHFRIPLQGCNSPRTALEVP
jgi:hypothetical protein